MSLEDHFDVALLGTGLTQSILAAALARAGFSVLHLDPNDYYGSECASLSLTELLEWAQRYSRSEDGATRSTAKLSDVELSWPAFDKGCAAGLTSVPAELFRLDRHYSLSLYPTLVPSVGPAIDAMVQSKVSSYCTFRLLERTVLYAPDTETEGGGKLQAVPSSKEDIFKDRNISLIDKRRLMKMLLEATGDVEQTFASSSNADNQEPFLSYLQRQYNLPRHLAQAITYGVALCSSDQDATLPSLLTAHDHLRSIGRYGNSAYLVGQYGGAGEMAQGYCRAAAVYGGTFILAKGLTKLASTSASPSKPANTDEAAASVSPAGSHWQLTVEGLDNAFTADWVVGSDDLLRDFMPDDSADNLPPEDSKERDSLRGIVVLDRPLHFGSATASGAEEETSARGFVPVSTADAPPPETALLIFPPGSLAGGVGDSASPSYTVSVLMMGEGTFSCPKGQYVYYLNTYADPTDAAAELSAKQQLQSALEVILKLAAPSAPEWSALEPLSPQGSLPVPLLELFYRSRLAPPRSRPSSASESTPSTLLRVPVPPPHTAPHNLTTLPSASVICARKLFYTIAGPGSEEAAERQRARRKRQRSDAEYLGRGARGPEDDEALGRKPENEDEGEVVEFFGPRKDEEQDQDDDS